MTPPTGPQESHPVGLRLLLGAQLRRLREKRGITREEAGFTIRASESKISRMELGRVGFKERDVADLLTRYGVVDEAERQALLSLARQANQPGWWDGYQQVLPQWFASYLGLEAAAAVIQTYEVQFVPGLLQTAEYARAVVRLGHRHANGFEVEQRVRLRMTRQELLRRPGAAALWAVVDEAALRRQIGGREVMRAQIGALLRAGSRPNITLQVAPVDAGGHSAVGGAFTILRFSDPKLPDVVYLEQLTSAVYLDSREEVGAYQAVMGSLREEAASPGQTVEILQALLREFDHHGDSGSI